MYGTLPEWRAYALARGNSAPTDADDAVATAAWVRGGDYIRMSYVGRFTAAHKAELPVEVEEAAYIASSLELATSGLFSKVFTPSEQTVLTEVEGIKWTVVGGSTGDVRSAAPVSTSIDALLSSFFGNYPAWVSA